MERPVNARPWIVAVAASVVAACGPNQDPLQIRYELTAGAAQSCPSQSCSDIPMTCDAVLQIRVVDPANPTTAYVSSCMPIDNPSSLCAISGPDLPSGLAIPTARVEVQIAVYPRTAIPVGGDGNLMCPTDLRCGAD